MSLVRCSECNARVQPPAALEAEVMRCNYCGHEQPVPDLPQRRAAIAARERLALEKERDAHANRQRDLDRREQRRSRRGTWMVSILSILVAPVIISVTIFDLPARLGFGSSGSKRLELIQAQLVSTGCTVLEPIDSEYADGNVSRLINVDPRCIRVLAAGGGGHSELRLELYSADGKQVAKTEGTTDPQLAYCSKTTQVLRYEIVVGPASKGRLSHLVLQCPK